MDDDERYYDGDYAPPAPVTVVTFGAPPPGNPAWTNNFNTKINARNIVFKGDPVNKVGRWPALLQSSQKCVMTLAATV
jgi:hypothetical protein